MPERTASQYAPNPFAEPSLTLSEASAFCGIAAALAFAIRAKELTGVGRYPTIEEAKRLAKEVGWTEQQGMAGPRSEKALLEKFGIPCYYKEGDVSEAELANQVRSGDPVIISTAGHYFVVDDYDPQRHMFHVGNTGESLKSGGPWMTYEQMGTAVGGNGINAMLVPRPPSDYIGAGGGTSAAGGPIGAAASAEAERNRQQNIQVYNMEIDRLTKLKDDPLQTDPKTGQISGGSQAVFNEASQRNAQALAKIAAIQAEIKAIPPYYENEQEKLANAKRHADLTNELQIAIQAQNQAKDDLWAAKQTLEDHKNQIAAVEKQKLGVQMITSRSLDDYAKQLTLDVAQGRLDSETASKLLQAQFDKAAQGVQGLTAAYNALNQMAPRMATRSMLDATVASLRGWNKFLPPEAQIPEFTMPFIPMGNILEEFQKYLPPKPDWETEQQAERALKGIYAGGKQGADLVASLFSKPGGQPATTGGVGATAPPTLEDPLQPSTTGPSVPAATGGTPPSREASEAFILRSEPRLEASKMEVVAGPTKVIGKPIQSGGVTWTQVQLPDGRTGWIYEASQGSAGPSVEESAERESIMRGTPETGSPWQPGPWNFQTVTPGKPTQVPAAAPATAASPRPPSWRGAWPTQAKSAPAAPTVPPSGTQATKSPLDQALAMELNDYLMRRAQARRLGKPDPPVPEELKSILADMEGQ